MRLMRAGLKVARLGTRDKVLASGALPTKLKRLMPLVNDFGASMCAPVRMMKALHRLTTLLLHSVGRSRPHRPQ